MSGYNVRMTTPSLQPATPPPESATPVIKEHIAVTPGVCGGKPRIAGHRIKVAFVALWHERMGLSPAQIVADHPGLTLADVHAALAYYHDHKEEIDADVAAGEEVAQSLEASQPSLLEKIARKRPDVLGLPTRAALAYVRSGHCPREDLDRLRTVLPERLNASPSDPDLRELETELEAVRQGR